MRKSLSYKILAAVLALTAINYALPANTTAGEVNDNYYVDNDGENVTGKYNYVYGNEHSFTFEGEAIEIFGSYNNSSSDTLSNINITVNNSNVSDNVFGVLSETNSNSTITNNHVTINSSKDLEIVCGASSSGGKVTNNYVTINDSEVSYEVCGGASTNGEVSNNYVIINESTINNINKNTVVRGGVSNTGDVFGNHVTINGGTLNSVQGGFSNTGNVNDNHVTISNATITGSIVGGYNRDNTPAEIEIKNNSITIKGTTDISNASLHGYATEQSAANIKAENNRLILDGWSGTAKSIHYFENIEFKNTTFTNGTVLNLQEQSDLDGLKNIKITNFAGGQKFKAGDTLTLISNTTNGLTQGQNFNATAGVAVDVGGVIKQDDNNVIMTVNSTSLNKQTNLAAQTRAASAAFVNQGTDLISDSLDTISRDSNYGVKTFAAVHGNRSKYDVNSDIKINGWSTIVGVGNADKFDNGSEFSWGVFYENGSGNYRTYNEFNNEFFRGDGSLVYNGGGIAARYTNKNGVYTEGSLRAGMLKSDMDNALRDGAGNFYGYESESAYYGAHIGIGKIISLSESSDLDIYGKFFHTYTEGDSFKVAGDEFEFDSINSDRLRIGARITSNKENKFSTYYGLAYEYEFNGDADMTAQGLKAPTQSLQGSSVMAEVGFNYQPTPTSPWSFDLNMRGYAGERQGGSFNVQATYTF